MIKKTIEKEEIERRKKHFKMHYKVCPEICQIQLDAIAEYLTKQKC